MLENILAIIFIVLLIIALIKSGLIKKIGGHFVEKLSQYIAQTMVWFFVLIVIGAIIYIFKK